MENSGSDMVSLEQQLSGYSVGQALRYLERREPGFCVIHHSAEMHDAQRPLVVLVHPGDMILLTDSYDAPAQRAAVAAFWGHIGLGTSNELADLRAEGADFCVLHRSSCTQYPGFSKYRRVGFGLWKEIKAGHRRGTVLYGDDLEAAARWMIEHLHIADRPRIHLAGAYSDPKHGCLTYLGQALRKVAGPGKIVVSPFSPPGNGPGQMWHPDGLPRPMSLPGEILDLWAQLEQKP